MLYVLEYDGGDDGPRLVGPFGTRDAADRFAVKAGRTATCNVVPLYVPEAA